VESKFDAIRRPVDPPKEKWTQLPLGTNAQDGWAALDFGKRGVAIFNQGLPEYEVETGGDTMRYWVTILRSVGWLSRGDMGYRPCHAGPGVATPEAQCRGEFHADIAIHPYEGTWQSAGIPRLAQEYLVPPATAGFYHGHREHRGSHDKPLRHSFLAVEPSNILASALKQAEDRPGTILRLWNPDTRAHRATVAVDRPLKSAWLVRLDEKRLSKIPMPSRGATSFEIDIHPRKIVTLELDYA
jgi:alpha-mannosidase